MRKFCLVGFFCFLLTQPILGSVSAVAAAFSSAQCGNSTSTCASASDCCASRYSPDHFGCLVYAGKVANTSVGCGDGLTIDANSNVCCKMGPENPPSTTLPNVLIIGDSVSIGYTTIASKNVVTLLEKYAAVQHGPWDVSDGGAGDTAMGVLCLDRWLMTQASQPVNWDLIAFNFGLHDMTNTTYCEDLYKAQLTNITTRLSNLGSKLVYMTTTPFMPRRLLNNTVVEDMNAIARTVMDAHNITVLDLYGLVASYCGPIPYVDCDICDVHPCTFHYNDDGENMQAKLIAKTILRELNQTSKQLRASGMHV